MSGSNNDEGNQCSVNQCRAIIQLLLQLYNIVRQLVGVMDGAGVEYCCLCT